MIMSKKQVIVIFNETFVNKFWPWKMSGKNVVQNLMFLSVQDPFKFNRQFKGKGKT
jgi:hypothetical protein